MCLTACLRKCIGRVQLFWLSSVLVPPHLRHLSTHRLAITNFWRTFHHDGKINPAWLVRVGVHSHPLSLYLPSRTNLPHTLQLRGQIKEHLRHRRARKIPSSLPNDVCIKFRSRFTPLARQSWKTTA